jgi:hypothetical protein
MNRLKALLVGVGHDPAVVGAFRAFLLYTLPLGVGALVAYLGALRDPRWLWLAALIPLIRALEGYAIDQLQKPTQNAAHPTPPAGEKPGAGIPAA